MFNFTPKIKRNKQKREHQHNNPLQPKDMNHLHNITWYLKHNPNQTYKNVRTELASNKKIPHLTGEDNQSCRFGVCLFNT